MALGVGSPKLLELAVGHGTSVVCSGRISDTSLLISGFSTPGQQR
jgi:hypothetical protein